MDIKKWIPFLAALLFLDASPSAEACTCAPGAHLQQAFCRSAALLKVQFIKPSRPDPTASNNDKIHTGGYKIKVLQVLKGSAKFQDLTSISTMAGSTCEYTHPKYAFDTDYLIAASSNGNGLSVNICSFKLPWSKLSREQIQGIQGTYLRGCKCDISYCFSQNCASESDRCFLNDSDGGDSLNIYENQMCAPNAKGTCRWEKIQRGQ